MQWKRPAAALAVAGVLLIPAAGHADNPATLRAFGADLESAEQQARLELFALESKLARAESALAGIQTRLDRLERERASSRRQLQAARRTLVEAEERLAEQVRALYISEQPDVLAVFLGAGSLEDAIDGVDSIHRAADATSGVLDEAQAARVRMASLLRRQTERRGELRQLRRSAVARTQELASARGDRLVYISELQAEQVLNERQIAEAVAAAEAAQASASVQTALAETAPSISSIGAQAIVDSPEPQLTAAVAATVTAGARRANGQDPYRRRHRLHGPWNDHDRNPDGIRRRGRGSDRHPAGHTHDDPRLRRGRRGRYGQRHQGPADRRLGADGGRCGAVAVEDRHHHASLRSAARSSSVSSGTPLR